MTEDVFIIPTSFAQQRLWLLEQLEPETTALNMSAAVRLSGALDRVALERSLNEVVRRHESLRTTFAEEGGEPVQVIATQLRVDLPLIELTAMSEDARAREVERLAREQAQEPFDLRQGPLLRVLLLQRAADEHVLLMTIHHIIADGWSVGIFIQEISVLYRAFLRKEPLLLPELRIQYADFALWQREWLQGEVLQNALQYWRGQLKGELPVLQMPTDKPRPAQQSYRGERQRILLSEHLSESLKNVGKREGATLFMTLLAAFKTLLFRYTKQEDVIVGTPIAGRNRSEVEGVIGFFINTLVLRTDLSQNPTFCELLHRLRKVALEAFAWQDLPFEKLLEVLQPDRALSHTPIFQIYFNMLNLPEAEIDMPGLRVEMLRVPEVEAKFDLTLYVKEKPSGIELELVYNADLFAPARMVEMLEQLKVLLSQIAENPQARLSDYWLVTPGARSLLPDPALALKDDWYGAVHEIFSRQSRRAPENIAAADRFEVWNYRDMEARSNQLAQYLCANGIERGDAVAIYGHRSAPLVWALLGIMKAGAAFVILDPAYPAGRLIACAELARPKGWLQMAAAGPLPTALEEYLATRPPLCRLVLPARRQADAEGLLMEYSIAAPDIPISADDSAYIAFTSGSTGMPKGILGRHGPLTHFTPWLQRTFGLHEGDRFSMLSGISHDPLHRDIFTPLQIGGAVFIPNPDDISVPGRVAEWMQRERISIAHLTPAMGQLLTETAPGEKLSPVESLRYVFLVGDVLTRSDVARLRAMAPAVTCVNYYGSTETQRAVGYFPVPNDAPANAASKDAAGQAAASHGKEVLPLGKGIEDVQLLVLNARKQLAGVGEIGEIYLRSPHLAKGYLGDEELTRERFITNPFTQKAGDRLYQTGDLGRYLPDGNVEPLGRADHQVKIRGFRVELGEIEALLKKHPLVQEAIAVVRDAPSGGKRLISYIVPMAAEDSTAAPQKPERNHGEDRQLMTQLRGYLRERVPDYMVPSDFVILSQLPVTPNGKVDRNSLPAPAESDATAAAVFVAPRTPVEEVLVAIWSNVLNVPRVGVHDNFFGLGGHSLLATRVVAQVRNMLQVELSLRRLFEAPTVAELAKSIEAARAGKGGIALPALKPFDRDRRLPLSFAQQRLWFLDKLEPGSPFYNMGAAARLTGELDIRLFAKSLAEVVNRHEILRTTFAEVDGRPQQMIAADNTVALDVEDLRSLPLAEREAEARRLAGQSLQQPFDLASGPLLRVKLFQLAEQVHILLVTMHHIISDGWSSTIFFRETAEQYAALVAGGGQASLAMPAVQYADFALWQRQWLAGETLERELDYWMEALKDAPRVLELPTDHPRPSVFTYRGARRHFTLDPALSAALEQVSQSAASTMFMTLLAAYQTLLYRYTGQTDICVGTPISGRHQLETEALIGCFVNTLVLRTDLSGEPGFRELLSRVREVTLGAYAHQNVPFEMLVERLQPVRSLSHTPLFQVALALQNLPAGVLEVPGLEFDNLELESGTAKFDLLLTLYETESGLSGFFEYSTDLFEPSTIARLASHFQNLLRAIAKTPDAPIQSLSLLSDAEQNQLLYDWSGADTRFPPEASLHRIFERQAQRRPAAPAVCYEQEQLTYAELNARANQLARHLGKAGVRRGSLVCVYLERSLDLVVGLLAILKAGGAYVPLNPSHAKQRLAFMLEDAGGEVVLTQRSLADELPPVAARVICVDGDWERVASESEENLADEIAPADLAYVIYTSGSTGTPKGVPITHANVVRLFGATQSWFAFDENDVWTLFHSYAFDFSVWEMWGALLYGGRLVVVPYWVSRSPDLFYELVREEKVSVLNQTPSAFRQFIEADGCATPRQELALRLVIFGGEALELRSLAPWLERYGDARPQLVNMYGITETTVHVTYQRLTEEQIRMASGSLIGRPIPDLQVYVLDPQLHPVPVGVPGEIHVGGEGLAWGYLRRPELTASRFIPNPFSREPGARLYKSGDLARWGEDGQLEYLGRIDDQVKIRGFRIELGEVEAALARHPAISTAVVLAVNDAAGVTSLVAYLVATEPAVVSVGELRGFLRDKLPDYMTPQSFIMLDSLPLTTNGKLDRRALLALRHAEVRSEKGFVPAQTPSEQTLAEIWATVLGKNEVGADDNFFEMGGDSILAIQIVSRARQSGLQITPKHLFQYQTIHELAAVADAAITGACAQEPVTGEVPLTSIQQWFFQHHERHPDYYNQAVLLQPREPLNPVMLEGVFRELVNHHDALRLRYFRDGGQWKQVNLAPLPAPAEQGGTGRDVASGFVSSADATQPDPLTIATIDLSELAEPQRGAIFASVVADIQASLELSNGPLLRVVQFALGAEQGWRLLIVVHHLAIDGISWRILLEDLETGYEQLRRGAAVQFAPKTDSFKRWAERLRDYAGSDEVAQELDYWLAKTAHPQPHLSRQRLPMKEARQRPVFASTRNVLVRLGAEDTEALLQEVPAAFQSHINDVLLAAMMTALNRWWGIRAIAVELEGHGRNANFPDLDISRTVGWFTTQFPVWLDISASESRVEAVRLVREQLRAVPNQGIGYGLLRYMRGERAIADRLGEPSPPAIRFNYLGQFDQLRNQSTLFAVAPESVGPVNSPDAEVRYDLEINCRVINSQLEVDWRYSEDLCRRPSIETLAVTYLDELRTLILNSHRSRRTALTPADFPLASIDQPALDRLAARYEALEDLYPLSPLQSGLLFHALQSPHSDVYFLHLSCRLDGRLDVVAFKRAWEKVVKRHTILRSAFAWRDLAEPLQVVQREVALPWEEQDWRQLPVAAQQEQLAAYLQMNRARGFDLQQAPLLRLALLRLADDAYQLVWSSHHIALDGWSYPIIIQEVLTFYDALQQGKTVELPPARPYRDYIDWLRRQDPKAQERFWRDTLRGFTAQTPLGKPSPTPRRPAPGGGYRLERLRLTSADTAVVRAFARDHHLTLNTLVQAAWALWLAASSARSEVLFGVVVSGRPVELSGAESMVGLLINSLPLRLTVSDQEPLLSWLAQVQEAQARLHQYEHSPLTEVQKYSEMPRGEALFDSLLTFLNYPVHNAVAAWDGPVKASEVEFVERVSYPLNLVASARSEMELEMKYDSRRFDAADIKQMLALLRRLLLKFAASPASSVESYKQLVTQADRQQRESKQKGFKQSRRKMLEQAKRRAGS